MKQFSIFFGIFKFVFRVLDYFLSEVSNTARISWYPLKYWFFVQIIRYPYCPKNNSLQLTTNTTNIRKQKITNPHKCQKIKIIIIIYYYLSIKCKTAIVNCAYLRRKYTLNIHIFKLQKFLILLRFTLAYIFTNVLLFFFTIF